VKGFSCGYEGNTCFSIANCAILRPFSVEGNFLHSWRLASFQGGQHDFSPFLSYRDFDCNCAPSLKNGAGENDAVS